MPWLEVLAQRGLSVFQDSGRRHRAGGVPTSGAFDRGAHLAATALVGGAATQATVEIAGMLALRAQVRCTVSVTGPVTVSLDEQAVPGWTAVEASSGSVLAVASAGRGYLAVAAGFRPPPVLGSRSTCLLSALGPAPIAAGDRLALATDPVAGTVGDWCRPPQTEPVLRAVPGPHLDLRPGRVTVLEGSRVGVRLRPDHPMSGVGHLPSLGVVPGAIQVLPSGDWMVLGPDAGTMGGYPVVGVVCTADLDRVAQLVEGDQVRIVPVAAESAPPPWTPRIVRASQL